MFFCRGEPLFALPQLAFTSGKIHPHPTLSHKGRGLKTNQIPTVLLGARVEDCRDMYCLGSATIGQALRPIGADLPHLLLAHYLRVLDVDAELSITGFQRIAEIFERRHRQGMQFERHCFGERDQVDADVEACSRSSDAGDAGKQAWLT